MAGSSIATKKISAMPRSLFTIRLATFQTDRQACEADLVIKHSGVGVDDALLENAVLECKSPNTQVAFWDVDAPATLASVKASVLHPFRALIPEYDYIFTYGGGPPAGRPL